MVDRQRETVGYLLRSKTFLMYIFYFFIFTSVTLMYTCGDFWQHLYVLSGWATTGLLVGNFIGTLAMLSTIFAWVLIDRNSWLGSAINYTIVSFCLIICSLSFMIQYFKGIKSDPHDVGRAHPDNPDHSFYKPKLPKPVRPPVNATGNYTNVIDIMHDDHVDRLVRAWMPGLMLLNFFQGILSVIFCIYLCISLDQVM